MSTEEKLCSFLLTFPKFDRFATVRHYNNDEKRRKKVRERFIWPVKRSGAIVLDRYEICPRWGRRQVVTG